MNKHDLVYLPPEQCIVGRIYYGRGRNFNYGRWDGKWFRGIRNKWNVKFLDGEIHWDLDDKHGTFKPIRICKA